MEMEQLAAITQALQLAGRPSFKPPSFSGEEDVDLFIQQFGDVAEANHWTPLERTLHLRSQLSGDAQSCGRGEDYDTIIEDLQGRYGLTKRKARDRLFTMVIRVGQDIHKQAAEISRLVGLAFPILPEPDRQSMALEYFSKAWESKAVQEHLLAIRPANVREAVRATEDFLAIHSTSQRPRANVVGQPEEEVAAARTTMDQGLMMMAEAMKTQTTLLQQLMMQLGAAQHHPSMGQMVGQPAPPQILQPSPEVKCYGCGGPHYKRNCPQRQQGNGRGPAQS